MKHPGLLSAALLVIILLVAAACASDELDPNATATPRPPDTVPASARTVAPTPTATTVVPTATAAPTTPGQAGPVELEIGVNGEALTFNLGSLSVPAGSQVVLTFVNSSMVNQHNWVLVPTSTKDDVAAAGTAAGPVNNWILPGDERVLASTVLLDAGATGSVEFTAPPTGTYQFVCTFPGHNFTMFGDFEVTG